MPKKSISLTSVENLFTPSREESLKDAPLSVRMRPQSLQEYIGQEHIVGPGKLLTRAIEADRLTSIILYGPPGVGKTTLALVLSRTTKAHFEQLNAVSANVEDLRKVILGAQNRKLTTGKKTILFVDEIHRFNKAQQDVLMPYVEEGNPILVGATVFNPYFAIIAPLVSRSLVFELQPLSRDNILKILHRALQDKEKGLGRLNIKVEEKALEFLAEISDGDARRALNSLELGCLTTIPDEKSVIQFTISIAEQSIQKKQVVYDRDEDGHYDTISAFIKSMRGSDPDATLYWLAKMIYAGEDPRFIARRICICASEDVGNADPQALILANAALQVAEFIGMPEARIVLAHAAVYVASAPKSNAVYLGIEKALDDVKNKKTQNVPKHLKDASYREAKKLGHGEGYKYAHDFEGHYVDQEYLSAPAQYYHPTEMGQEKAIKERIEKIRSSK